MPPPPQPAPPPEPLLAIADDPRQVLPRPTDQPDVVPGVGSLPPPGLQPAAPPTAATESSPSTPQLSAIVGAPGAQGHGDVVATLHSLLGSITLLTQSVQRLEDRVRALERAQADAGDPSDPSTSSDRNGAALAHSSLN